MRFSSLRQVWTEFRAAPPGRRFRARYQRRTDTTLKGSRFWARCFAIIGAMICPVIAIPLLILPGPAIVFFTLAGLLLAGESRFFAALCDYVELLIHTWIRRLQKRRHARLIESA